MSSRRTALAAATGGDGAAARGPSAAGGRSGSGATSAASALRPPETLPSDNPLSREQVRTRRGKTAPGAVQPLLHAPGMGLTYIHLPP